MGINLNLSQLLITNNTKILNFQSLTGIPGLVEDAITQSGF